MTPTQRQVADKISKGLSEDTLRMSPVEVVRVLIEELEDHQAVNALQRIK